MQVGIDMKRCAAKSRAVGCALQVCATGQVLINCIMEGGFQLINRGTLKTYSVANSN